MAIDDIDARETGSQRVMAKSHAWQIPEERVRALKKAIEASGWKTKKDDKLVIEALEDLTLNNSLGNPQGTKIIRREDHSGMIECYISKVENGRPEVKKKITKEELMAQLPARFDFSKQSV